MMKKVVYLFIFLVSLFAVGCNEVYASKGEISYDIEKMNIDNDYITFKGWAIAHDANNIGGFSSKISIIATDGKTTKEVSASQYINNNLYLGLCINDNGVSQCVPEYLSACFNADNLGSKKLNDKPLAGVDRDIANRSCIYRNVGFTIKFRIQELKDLFKSNDVKFKLRVYYNDSCTVNTNSGKYSYVSPSGRIKYAGKNFDLSCSNNNFKSSETYLAVHTNIVYKNGTKANINDGKLEINDRYYFVISGISNKVMIIDNNNRIQSAGGVKYNAYLYFKSGENTINSNKPVLSSDIYQVNMYSLNGYEKKISRYADCSKNNGCTDAYALASWLKTKGSITLKFEPEEDVPEVTRNCAVNTNNAQSSCSWESGTNDGRYSKPKITYSGSSCRRYETEIYFPSKYSDNICRSRYDVCTGGVCYLKASMSTTVNFTQNGYLEYYHGPYSIYSGGATQFSVTYRNSIIWDYEKKDYRYGYDISPIYYNRNRLDYYESSCGEDGHPCCASESTEISDTIDLVNSYGLLNKDKKRVANGEEIIETFTANDYDSNFLNTLESNYSISVPKNDIEGYWTGTNATITNNRWRNGQVLNSSYTYNLYNAYINRTDGEVIYKKTEISDDERDIYLYRPKNYFIPLNFKTGEYVFKFTIDDLSTMKNNGAGGNDLFEWTNVYECGINCKQKFYGEKDGYYFKYRPIDLNNVFPRGNAGFQWRQWMETDPIVKEQVKRDKKLVLDDEKELKLEVDLDSDTMSWIRNYNNNNEHLGGYLNDSINTKGESDFLLERNYSVKGNKYKLGCGSLNKDRGDC